MKQVVRKSAVPQNRTFVVMDLVAPYFDPSWHFHPEYQLFVVLKGEGTRFIGDHIKIFRPYDMVLTGPNLPHLWRNYESYFDQPVFDQTRGIVIYFNPDFLGSSIRDKEELMDIHRLLARSQRGLEIHSGTNRVVTEMMIELTGMKGAASIIQLLKILQVLATTSDCTPLASEGYTNINKVSETDRMNKIYDYVSKHFVHRVPISEVAKISNMSVSSFSRYFKSRTNRSFSDFVSELRIGHSCRLLQNEQLSISQISLESGFNTLSNFNKIFKKVKGVTPREYRKAYLDATKL